MTTGTMPTTQRLLAPGGPDLATHEARHGAIPWRGSKGRLVADLEASGLAGRGGAAFPAARKLAAVAQGRGAVVIANGAEGEPASLKDRTLLMHSPHLVLDGLQLAAEAVGANRVYAYVSEPAVPAVTAALRERARRHDRVPTDVVAAPQAFVAGQESAVVNALEGGPALPRDTPRLLVESGLHGAPTLVQNVETLANLALIARYGAEWFRAVGTPEDPGTFLATVCGSVPRAGVYELPYGIPLGRALAAAGPVPAVQAVLVGGFHGAWVPGEALATPISRAGLGPYGAAPGAGVLLALRRDACPLVESATIMSYLARESAGQCGPCLNGLPRLAETLTSLAHRRSMSDPVGHARWFAYLVNGRGACRHPDGTARFVQSTFRVFEREVQLHLRGHCRVGP
jgi:NADH:ubiquinone oxidoreductase subunit F (NADH-binding)